MIKIKINHIYQKMSKGTANQKTMSDYKYKGPLNGGYAVQDKEITKELEDFCMSTSEWHDFFVADGITDHRERFLTTFGRWIRRSKLNSIKGLDAFTHVTLSLIHI